jgi:hypothetical protein
MSTIIEVLEKTMPYNLTEDSPDVRKPMIDVLIELDTLEFGFIEVMQKYIDFIVENNLSPKQIGAMYNAFRVNLFKIQKLASEWMGVQQARTDDFLQALESFTTENDLDKLVKDKLIRLFKSRPNYTEYEKARDVWTACQLLIKRAGFILFILQERPFDDIKTINLKEIIEQAKSSRPSAPSGGRRTRHKRSGHKRSGHKRSGHKRSGKSGHKRSNKRSSKSRRR